MHKGYVDFSSDIEKTTSVRVKECSHEDIFFLLKLICPLSYGILISEFFFYFTLDSIRRSRTPKMIPLSKKKKKIKIKKARGIPY